MNLVIGLGKVFWEYYYPNINPNNYHFYDKNISELPDSLTYISNFNKILDREYKCIYVLTPPSTRDKIISALHPNTSSFYIEKPVFTSLEEFKRTKSIVKEVYLLGGHSRRFFNNYINIKNRILADNGNNRITNISITEGSIYKWNPKIMELISNDELSHMIDSLLYILNFTDKQIDYEIKEIIGDNISNLYIECVVDNINIDINFSRNSDLINQIRIDFDNDTSYLLNSKLNGSLQFLNKNNLSDLHTAGKKQSSVSVFKQIITHIDSDSYIKDNNYKLTKFSNTLMIVDNIKKDINR